MKPGRFTYEAPTSLDAALVSLGTWRDDAKVIAGGQSLAPMLNMRLARPEHLIDINGLADLARIFVGDDVISIGALVRHDQLGNDELVKRHCPMLASAANTIGHYAIRQRGTIGGSIAHADPAAQLPLAALALDAEFVLQTATRRRTVPASAFFLSIFTTVIEPDELLVGVRLPVRLPREGWGFRLFARRAGDFAIVSVAAVLECGEGTTVNRLRLAIGGIGPVPVRAEHLVPPDLIDGRATNWSSQVAAAVAAGVEIEDNERMPTAFRRELVEQLVRDVLDDALERT